MKTKRVFYAMSIIAVIGMAIFLSTQLSPKASTSAASSEPLRFSSSANDVGASAPHFRQLSQSSSSNDVGAGSPYRMPIPVTGGNSSANDVGTYRIMNPVHVAGWRDAGANPLGEH